MIQYFIGYLCIELGFFLYMLYVQNIYIPKQPVNTYARFENSIELTRDIFRLVDEFAETVRCILDHHSLDKITLLGHSYGTFLCTWLLRIIPDRISRVCFIDPLMLTVALYETAYYLFYRKPQTITDWIYYVFVRSNMPLANVLQRHFVWYNMVLKLDEIPKNIDVCVAYSQQEHLLDPALMHQLVKRGSNDIIYWNKIHHAECIGNDKCVKDIVTWLKSL